MGKSSKTGSLPKGSTAGAKGIKKGPHHTRFREKSKDKSTDKPSGKSEEKSKDETEDSSKKGTDCSVETTPAAASKKSTSKPPAKDGSEVKPAAGGEKDTGKKPDGAESKDSKSKKKDAEAKFFASRRSAAPSGEPAEEPSAEEGESLPLSSSNDSASDDESENAKSNDAEWAARGRDYAAKQSAAAAALEKEQRLHTLKAAAIIAAAQAATAQAALDQATKEQASSAAAQEAPRLSKLRYSIGDDVFIIDPEKPNLAVQASTGAVQTVTSAVFEHALLNGDPIADGEGALDESAPAAAAIRPISTMRPPTSRPARSGGLSTASAAAPRPAECVDLVNEDDDEEEAAMQPPTTAELAEANQWLENALRRFKQDSFRPYIINRQFHEETFTLTGEHPFVEDDLKMLRIVTENVVTEVGLEAVDYAYAVLWLALVDANDKRTMYTPLEVYGLFRTIPKLSAQAKCVAATQLIALFENRKTRIHLQEEADEGKFKTGDQVNSFGLKCTELERKKQRAKTALNEAVYARKMHKAMAEREKRFRQETQFRAAAVEGRPLKKNKWIAKPNVFDPDTDDIQVYLRNAQQKIELSFDKDMWLSALIEIMPLATQNFLLENKAMMEENYAAHSANGGVTAAGEKYEPTLTYEMACWLLLSYHKADNTEDDSMRTVENIVLKPAETVQQYLMRFRVAIGVCESKQFTYDDRQKRVYLLRGVAKSESKRLNQELRTHLLGGKDHNSWTYLQAHNSVQVLGRQFHDPAAEKKRTQAKEMANSGQTLQYADDTRPRKWQKKGKGKDKSGKGKTKAKKGGKDPFVRRAYSRFQSERDVSAGRGGGKKSNREETSWKISGVPLGTKSKIHERFLKAHASGTDDGEAKWKERKDLKVKDYPSRPDLFYSDMLSYNGHDYKVCTICQLMNSHQAHECPKTKPDYKKKERFKGTSDYE